MRIGIVVPAFNVAPYIGETIRSVLAQTHRDWTMVVVDDGSADQTASVVEGFRDPRIRLIAQDNHGVSAARNRGAASLDCEAMLFLDGDDRLAPFALEALFQGLLAAPDAIAAVGAYERGGRVYRPELGNLLERLLVRNLFVNGGHLLIRRHAVQPFRPDLHFGEDWECWVRLVLSQTPSSPGLTRPPPAMTMVSGHLPILHVRERPHGAYLRMAIDPMSFLPCLNAIHGNPALPAIFPPRKRAVLRWQADAEMRWTIGRELIRHRRFREGLGWLGHAFLLAPSPRRAAVLAAVAVLPPRWRGPLYPY